MCDGKHASRRDVVILSIKPKRPEYPLNVKVVPVSELLQEWDKLEAYYRGQLLKLTKSFKKQKHSHSNSATRSPSSNKGKSQASKGSSPVDKKHSADQFNELFGDENIFSTGGGGHLPRDTNNNNNNNSSQSNRSKLLHSRSLNSLFDDDGTEQRAPSSLSHPRISRKDSFSSVNSSNSSLLVSIPVLSVGGDNFGGGGGRSRWHSDDEDDELLSESEAEDDERTNFLSVPRDNFKVQYGMKAKKRVALIQTGGGSVSPRWIVPVRVIPYKPPAAQGLNGVQIQKILYHKNDSVNYASPTTTTATTPDKPPDIAPSPLPPSRSSSKSTKDSPASTVSPHSLDNNNATPKSTCSSSSPNLASPKSDLSKPVNKPVSSPPPIVNSSSGHKLKRVAPKTEHVFSGQTASLPNKTTVGGKRRRFTDTPQPFETAPGFNFAPVTSTSSNYPFQSSGNSSSSEGSRSTERETSTSTSPKKVIKDVPLTKPSPSSSASPPTAVFITPAALSITDRIIKKANRPQPELIERQRRRRQESDRRKSYAMQKGDEHEQRESIDLSMKSFEMIWNVPLLSPLRSP